MENEKLTESDKKPEMIMQDLTVLFVEDNPDDVELAELWLKKNGFTLSFQVIDTEEELRNSLAERPPQIILCDYSMPNFDGMTALRIARELVPDIPFIFLSGTIGEERAIQAIHNGATDYVLKNNMLRLGPAINRALKETAERQRLNASEQSRAMMSTIIEATSDFVIMANPEGGIIYMNQGARSLLERGEEDIEGKSVRDIFATCAWNSIKIIIQTTLEEHGIWQGYSVLLTTDGQEVPVSQVLMSHKNADGKLEYYSYIARDMRERDAYEKQIQYLANYDPLTELPNRNLLADRVAQTIEQSKRLKQSIAFLVFNIDRFKLINEGFGQASGDLLLQQVSARIQGIMRSGDTLARLDADNFVMLLEGISSIDDVVPIVRDINSRLSVAFVIKDQSFDITIRIGISVYPRDGEDFISLLQAAEAAEGQVKKGKDKNKFRFYQAAMTRDAASLLTLEQDLRLAPSRHEIEMYYQPQYSLKDMSVVGFEALMRWKHPDRGIVPPAVFIPLAEKSDLILRLGEYALESACRQLSIWDSEGLPNASVAVNVSAHQFHKEGLVGMVNRILKRSQLDPQRLELEITEGFLLKDHEVVAVILKELNTMGVRIALDDFGTGYSSLKYLSRLPLTYLKIDQSFVGRCLTDSKDGEIVRAIIALAKSMHLKVIGEGIETREQNDFLSALDCDIGQGYLFSKPIPAKAVPSFMLSYKQDSDI